MLPPVAGFHSSPSSIEQEAEHIFGSHKLITFGHLPYRNQQTSLALGVRLALGGANSLTRSQFPALARLCSRRLERFEWYNPRRKSNCIAIALLTRPIASGSGDIRHEFARRNRASDHMMFFVFFLEVFTCFLLDAF